MTSTEVPLAVHTPGAICQKCRRGGGRDRSPHSAIAALIAATAVVVCDRCWHAAGGSAAVQAEIADDGHVEVSLHCPADIESLFAEATTYDSRHPIDRLLISSGIRWATLRHIAAPARYDLVRWILERAPDASTRVASSPDVWLDAVTARIQQQTGTTFKYNCKRRRWWAIANVFRRCGDWDGRPLTWVSQTEIATAVGCSSRTVRRCVAWLQREGLLREVVPGCQLPRQSRPDEETLAERATRLARSAAAVAAEDAAIARARAELVSISSAGTGPAPAPITPDAAAEGMTEAAVEADLLADMMGEWLGDGLIQLAPVYELRVAAPPSEMANEAAVSQLRAHHNSERSTEAATRTDATSSPAGSTIVRPPKVDNKQTSVSKPAHPVDNKRPASPGIEQHEPDGSGRSRSTSQQSEAARAAQWLLTSRLHPDLCIEVSPRWLATLIRGSRLLSDWDWDWDDLADLIHGVPDYPHLPRWVRNPRGWIRARFRQAVGHLTPRKQAFIQHIERTSPHMQHLRVSEAARVRREEIAALRAAIATCPHCDELGWHDADPSSSGTAVFRCNHDPATGGW